MEEIITGMIHGKPEPTPEEMECWLTQELEREAEGSSQQTISAREGGAIHPLFLCSAASGYCAVVVTALFLRWQNG